MASIGSIRTLRAAVLVAGLALAASAPALAAPAPGRDVRSREDRGLLPSRPPGPRLPAEQRELPDHRRPGRLADRALSQQQPRPGGRRLRGRRRHPGGRTHGFLLDKGKARTVDGPGRALTELFGINDRGRVVGGYVDAGGKVRGLLRDAKGTFTVFDAPMAASQTGPLDINDRRQIVGVYR